MAIRALVRSFLPSKARRKAGLLFFWVFVADRMPLLLGSIRPSSSDHVKEIAGGVFPGSSIE